jgi:hypothetical protein
MEYPENHYDIVYNRGTILLNADKKSLCQNFFKALKPGSRVVITNYCKGNLAKAEYGQDFKDYVPGHGYHLLTVEQNSQVSVFKMHFTPGLIFQVKHTFT